MCRSPLCRLPAVEATGFSDAVEEECSPSFAPQFPVKSKDEEGGTEDDDADGEEQTGAEDEEEVGIVGEAELAIREVFEGLLSPCEPEEGA